MVTTKKTTKKKSDEIDYLFVYPTPTIDSPNQLVPLSIIYPGNYYIQKGYNVKFHDCRFDTDEELYKLVKKAKRLAISSMTGIQCGESARIMIKAKKINPKIKTILGGYHATLRKDEVLKEPFVDEVFVGRMGEEYFPYNKHTKYLFDRTAIQWFTSTGCAHNCSFCCLEHKWNPKPLKQVEHELRTLHKDQKFKYIIFGDPNLGGDLLRIKKIGEILKDLGVTFHANIRTDYLSPKMVKTLVDANCVSLEIGCESGDDYVLEHIVYKGHKSDAILKAAKNLRGTGISTMYSFITDMPYETKKQKRATLNIIDKIHKIDKNARTSIYGYTPFPNTPMFDMAVKLGYKPPSTMIGWSKIGMSQRPLYWIAGIKFRKDNVRRNFPGLNRLKILPFEVLSEFMWRYRITFWYPSKIVEKVIQHAVEKNTVNK